MRGSEDVLEVVDQTATKHISFKSVLASDRYGALREWSTKQSAYLKAELPSASQMIEVQGRIDGGMDLVDRHSLDKFLSRPQPTDATRVMLIDGPAGIGKTYFILRLAEHRAANYLKDRRPLILHVESRGRTLSYIYSLIAYSLQSLRLGVTYDQIPVLAKHGLITLAIDGFDELADPDGYELAWSQVSELIAGLRGAGAIILAGRETFIGRDRIVKDIASVRVTDEVSVLTLQAPTKSDAINWLRAQAWDDDQIGMIEAFLEPQSLALRPFFLKTLADPTIALSLASSSATSVLAILMDAMIEREVGKFGEAVEKELSKAERGKFIRNLMGEIARDMAESTSVAVSDAAISYMVEAALPRETSDSVTRLLKARGQVVAFLTNDDKPGYRRFFHDKFFEYFLSSVIIEIVPRGEISKALSRNILGSSLLETFGSVIASGTPTALVRTFIESSMSFLASYPPIDRTRRNLGALLVAALPAAEGIDDVVVSAVDIDEARVFGTSARSSLTNVVISQLDCRGADLANSIFEESLLITVIGDGATLLPDSFPIPHRVQDVSSSSGVITRPEDARAWVQQHLANPTEQEQGLIPLHLRDHGAFRLLAKACRMRQYWLRAGDDIYAAKVLEDEHWPLVESALDESGLLRVEYRQASGTNARFIHIRQAQTILAEDASDPEVLAVYANLTAKLDGVAQSM